MEAFERLQAPESPGCGTHLTTYDHLFRNPSYIAFKKKSGRFLPIVDVVDGIRDSRSFGVVQTPPSACGVVVVVVVSIS